MENIQNFNFNHASSASFAQIDDTTHYGLTCNTKKKGTEKEKIMENIQNFLILITLVFFIFAD